MHENDINNSTFEQDNTDDLIDLFQSRTKQSRNSSESSNDAQKSTKESKQITRAESFAMFVVLVVLVSVCNFGLHSVVSSMRSGLVEQISYMDDQIVGLQAQISNLESKLNAYTEKDPIINVTVNMDGENIKDVVVDDDNQNEDEVFDEDFDASPFLGVAFNEGNDGSDNPLGIRVDYVFEYSPAAFVGIKPGDIITSINDAPISTMEDLTNALSQYKAKETILVGIITYTETGVEYLVLPVELTYRGNFDLGED